jgi:hypothetical protein
MPSLPNGQLNRIWSRIHQRVYRSGNILDSLQETRLIEKTVVYGHVKTPTGQAIEHPVQTKRLHKIKQLSD